MSVVNPMDYGAAGNGSTNDLTALTNTIAALPASGGIVYLPAGTSFKKQAALTITKEHVKFWAPNRQAEIFASTPSNGTDLQTVRSTADGFGFFGVKLRGDATARGDTLEDHMICADGCTLVEVVGCEIVGSIATGMFLRTATELYINGNYVHHTWADHIHHTDVSRDSWCWENWIINGAPYEGDDGIACVTYDPTGPLGGNMEWWNNIHLGSVNGRGYSVIGGEDINIHDNWAIDVAGAGLLVASEPAFDSNTSRNILMQRNYITGCGHTIGHPGILLASGNPNTANLDNIDVIDNVSANNINGSYDTIGTITNVTHTGTSTSPGDLPRKPSLSYLAIKDTTIMCTRDVSHVSAGQQPGLYRIHVRVHPSGVGSGFQERFEYVVKGTPTDVTNWVALRRSSGDYISDQQTISGTAYALLLSSTPLTLGSGISAVTHTELRAGDQIGSTGLNWLWARINNGTY